MGGLGRLIRKVLCLLFTISCAKPVLPVFNPSSTSNYTNDEIQMVELVNTERRMGGAKELLLDDFLSKLAKERTRECASIDTITHDGYPRVLKTVIDAGLNYAGENLAFKFYSVETAVKAWVDSPDHDKNLMDNRWIYTGVAIYEDKGNLYYCQIFAR